MFSADDLNLSDAILLAMHHKGWIDLFGRGAPAPPKKEEKRPPSPRPHYPRPKGIKAPPGVTWKAADRRWVGQVSIRRRMHSVCLCEPTQAGAMLAGELVALARSMRDAGASIAEIHKAVRERVTK